MYLSDKNRPKYIICIDSQKENTSVLGNMYVGNGLNKI